VRVSLVFVQRGLRHGMPNAWMETRGFFFSPFYDLTLSPKGHPIEASHSTFMLQDGRPFHFISSNKRKISSRKRRQQKRMGGIGEAKG